MSIEIPELRLGWAPAVVRGSLRRTLIDFMTVFAVPRPTEPNVLRMRRLIWGMNAVAALCAVVGILVLGFHINIWKAAASLALALLVATACAFVRRRFQQQTPAALIESLAQLLTAIVWAELLSYLFGSFNMPWADGWLAAADSAIGFNWVAVSRAVARHDFISTLLLEAYKTFVWQLPLVLTLLAFRMSHRRLQLFVFAWLIAMAVAVLGLIIAPAKTAYIFFGATQGTLPDLSAYVGRTQYEALELLRAGDLRQLLDQDMEGLVTFPSFHSAAAVLFAWAAWPMRWVRWTALVLNLTMLVSVPVVGSHYLVDVFGGVVVAVAAIWIAHAADASMPRRYFEF